MQRRREGAVGHRMRGRRLRRLLRARVRMEETKEGRVERNHRLRRPKIKERLDDLTCQVYTRRRVSNQRRAKREQQETMVGSKGTVPQQPNQCSSTWWLPCLRVKLGGLIVDFPDHPRSKAPSRRKIGITYKIWGITHTYNLTPRWTLMIS